MRGMDQFSTMGVSSEGGSRFTTYTRAVTTCGPKSGPQRKRSQHRSSFDPGVVAGRQAGQNSENSSSAVSTRILATKYIQTFKYLFLKLLKFPQHFLLVDASKKSFFLYYS